MRSRAPWHTVHAKNNASWHKISLRKPLPVAAWAVRRESAHNAPHVERRRGQRALQSLPTAEEAVQEPRGGRGASWRWLLTRRLKPRGGFWACSPPAVPPSEIATESPFLRPEKGRMQAGVSRDGVGWCARKAARHDHLHRSRSGRAPFTSCHRRAARGGSSFHNPRSPRGECRLICGFDTQDRKLLSFEERPKAAVRPIASELSHRIHKNEIRTNISSKIFMLLLCDRKH